MENEYHVGSLDPSEYEKGVRAEQAAWKAENGSHKKPYHKGENPRLDRALDAAETTDWAGVIDSSRTQGEAFADQLLATSKPMSGLAHDEAVDIDVTDLTTIKPTVQRVGPPPLPPAAKQRRVARGTPPTGRS